MPPRTFSPGTFGWRLAAAVLFIAVGGLVALLGIVVATRGSAESGELYFTINTHTALFKVGFDFRSGTPHFGPQKLVAKLPGADGVVFEPDGHALVGGQGTGRVEEVDPASGAFRSVPSGCAGAYLLAVDPAADAAYTAGLPGPLCKMSVDPLRSGTSLSLRGDDTQVTNIAFDQGGRAFYTTGVSSGPGSFGSLDLGTGSTTRQLTQIAAGHSLTFDTYSRTLYLFGGETIMQIDPRQPQRVVSSMTIPGVQLDAGTTDGLGHVFVASNFGQLVVVDDRASGRLGTPNDRVTIVPLRAHLDDIAPLVGPGAAASSGRRWLVATAAGFGTLALAALVALFGHRLRPRSTLPSWDIRRKEAERPRTRPRGPGPPTRPGLGRFR